MSEDKVAQIILEEEGKKYDMILSHSHTYEDGRTIVVFHGYDTDNKFNAVKDFRLYLDKEGVKKLKFFLH